nr:MAG TPA: hypothetical protein [Microviridae sp.]
MMRRYKLPGRYNKSEFRRTARRVHKKNLARRVSRGGVRL